jgi:DnaJ-class molecular chaperone
MKTPADETKQNIRYRRFRELRRAGRPIPPELAAHFASCNSCAGRGQVGYATLQNGCPVEVDDVCQTCNGDGFVQVGSV